MKKPRKKEKFGRAFMGAINSDWAITEAGYRQVLEKAARINADKMLEAYDSKKLEYTRNVSFRDGIAIIPVEGPIFRYANMFTAFSGATSVEILSKDIRAALDSSDVNAILLEINSPGGEVTGINELGDMIYNARGIKPMTARIGGLGASAAYWLGSACGTIPIDETAIVGSIGVRTVYLDNKKNLKDRGFEEIEIVSSQSPFKLADGAKISGRARIQSRLDAICGVFISKVARNRDVSIETVINDYGQGDVFVGQQAIDAGLADYFGSFEDTLDNLANEHTPNYSGSIARNSADFKTLETTVSNSATLKFEDNLSSQPEREENIAEQPETKSEENMSEENKNLKAKEADESKSKTEEKNLAEDKKQDSKTDELKSSDITAKKDKKAESGSSSDPRDAEIASLREKLEKTTAKADSASSELRQNRFATVAKNFAGDKDSKISLMENLADSLGETSTEFVAYVEDQNALAAQIEEAGLFKEVGAPGADSSLNSAETKLEKLAKEKAKVDGCTYEQAYSKICDENDNLFAQAQSG